MKNLDPALQSHLDEGTTTLAWCWRIVRADGVTFGFTDHDRTLSFNGTDFEPESGLTASEVRSGSDLSVDAQAEPGHGAVAFERPVVVAIGRGLEIDHARRVRGTRHGAGPQLGVASARTAGCASRVFRQSSTSALEVSRVKSARA